MPDIHATQPQHAEGPSGIRRERFPPASESSAQTPDTVYRRQPSKLRKASADTDRLTSFHRYLLGHPHSHTCWSSQPVEENSDGLHRLYYFLYIFFFNDTATTEIYTLSHTTLFRSSTCS